MATTGAGRLRVTSHPENYSLEVLHPRRRKNHNRVPSSMRQNFHLNHPDLSKGQKRYLWSICSIYSTAQMKQLVQDQFINQLFYEISKGIVQPTDWRKYLEYISDPKKRKQQFQSLSAKRWRAPKDQYKYRYYRDHPVDLPRPKMPPLVQNMIDDELRPPPPPQPRAIRYRTRRRRQDGSQATFPQGADEGKFSPKPPVMPRQQTSTTSSSSTDSYSLDFSGSGDSSSNDASSDSAKPGRTIKEGFTRPKSRIGSRPRTMVLLD
ncbi:unnamed protein product [Clavelina lepadiformis]|uniref:Uncharacterized protein n=1 Tax=Clavelina lepadiformis TaxID=159417 RepID=A0ABP0GQC4_CLALP